MPSIKEEKEQLNDYNSLAGIKNDIATSANSQLFNTGTVNQIARPPVDPNLISNITADIQNNSNAQIDAANSQRVPGQPIDFDSFDRYYWGNSDSGNVAKPETVVMSNPQMNTDRPNNNLSTRANIINNNPDTQNWAPSDIAKANHFGDYGNPWNPAMNTKGATFDNTSITANNKQKSSLTSPKQLTTPTTVQSYGEGQVKNTSFSDSPIFKDAYGNVLQTSQTYDAAGNLMTRADQEQAKNSYLARELARQAAEPDKRLPQLLQTGYTDPMIVKGRNGSISQIGASTPTYQVVNPVGPSAGQAASEALRALTGVTGTTGDYESNKATAGLRSAQALAIPEELKTQAVSAKASANYNNSMARINDTKEAAEKNENEIFKKYYKQVLGLDQDKSNESQTLQEALKNRKKQQRLSLFNQAQ